MKFLAVFFLLFLSACAEGEVSVDAPKINFEKLLQFDFLKDKKFNITKTEFSALPEWTSDRHTKAIESFANSCEKIMKIPAGGFLSSEVISVRAAYMKDACTRLPSYFPARAQEFFEENFYPFKVSQGDTTGKFTGYFVPILNGSRTPSKKYFYPIYAVPPDYKPGQKYLSRFDIEQGALSGRDLEILYLDSHVDGFFLHVQGSGYVRLDTGENILLSFAAKNNHTYTAIGKVMVEEGLLAKENVSMQSIKAWLNANPALAGQIMNMNDSFIFFRESQVNYVIGAGGVALIQDRSLAVDKSFIPLHMPVFVSIMNDRIHYNNLMMAQDVGSAIKGAIRGDIFFGIGEVAGEKAGRFNEQGSYYIFIPKAAVDKQNVRR